MAIEKIVSQALIAESKQDSFDADTFLEEIHQQRISSGKMLAYKLDALFESV